MAAPTYATRAIVLRKTRLSESDLILTMLATDGSQLRAVAKGARKPTSVFASRLELFSEADLLCAEGKSLDVIKEARLENGHRVLRDSLEHATAAAPVAELIARMTEVNLKQPRLFDATSVALDALCAASPQQAPAVAAAHLLKTLAICGLRPAFDECAVCAVSLETAGSDRGNERGTRISYAEGGIVCARCAASCETVSIDATSLSWARFLLGSTYAAIGAQHVPLGASFSVLRIVQGLVREHVGGKLKSLEFLMSCGLFGDGIE